MCVCVYMQSPQMRFIVSQQEQLNQQTLVLLLRALVNLTHFLI